MTGARTGGLVDGTTVGSTVLVAVGELVGEAVDELVAEALGETVADPVGETLTETVGEPVADVVADVVAEALGDSVTPPVTSWTVVTAAWAPPEGSRPSAVSVTPMAVTSMKLPSIHRIRRRRVSCAARR